jgi:hypothetical protein
VHLRPRCSRPDFGRPVHLVLRGSVILVAVRFVLAGHAGVADISGATMRPAIGKSACWVAIRRRRLDCRLIDVVGSGRSGSWRYSCGLVGTVESCSFGCGSKTAIEIGFAKETLEVERSFKFRRFVFLLAQKIDDFSVLRGLNESLSNNVLYGQNVYYFAVQAGH